MGLEGGGGEERGGGAYVEVGQVTQPLGHDAQAVVSEPQPLQRVRHQTRARAQSCSQRRPHLQRSDASQALRQDLERIEAHIDLRQQTAARNFHWQNGDVVVFAAEELQRRAREWEGGKKRKKRA